MHPITGTLDPHIAPVVELLRGRGFNTFTSCDGGEGHAFQMPTVRIDPAPVDVFGGLATIAHAVARDLLAAGYKAFYVKIVRGYGGSVEIGRKVIDSFIEIEFWIGPPPREVRNGEDSGAQGHG